MTAAVFRITALAALLLPTAVEAQRSGNSTYVDGRLSELQRTVASLSSQLEQLKAQDRQLQQQLEKMQASFGQRLERLEKGAAAKPVPRSGKSRH